MRENIIKRIIFSILGIAIIGLGVGMNIKLGLGTDALNAAYTGISKTFGPTIGQVTTIVSAIMAILTLFLNKKRIGLGSILGVFGLQPFIDLAYDNFPIIDNLVVGYLLFVLSIIIIAIGAGILATQDLGLAVYDAFIFGISDRCHIRYTYIRYIVDGLFFLIAIILKGEIGYGTIIFLLMIGICVETSIKVFKKLDNKIFK